MSDPAFVTAAYGVVLGGLALYVFSLARRARSAHRTAKALERERRKGASLPSAGPAAPLEGRASEARR